MTTIQVDFSKTNGPIKAMNAVNNGPVSKSVRGMSNFEDYKALEIPYARNHDASFCSNYGGEHTVDVHRIFRNFDADENDPASYIFSPTDKYIANTTEAGTKTFYRLGASIEHGYKYGTYPPKDFAKWARICEHIIMHYTEGWADGFHYDIEYWEIWNEPDCGNPDGSNPCWQGTEEEFNDLYCTTAIYLKNRFPHLKIGGPAFCASWKIPFRLNFLAEVKRRNAPLDFYSFHGYLTTPDTVLDLSREAVESLAENGLTGAELIYNEWNYVKGWVGEDYIYSMRSMKGLKGSAFVAGVMAAGQASDIDMLMYYDFRPGMWSGVFDEFHTRRKPYYSFRLFRDLRRLGTWVPTELKTDNIYTCAATNGKDSGILLTHFTEEDTTPAAEVKVDFHNLTGTNGVKASYYLLDNDHDAELVREEIFTASEACAYLTMPLFGSYLIQLTAL